MTYQIQTVRGPVLPNKLGITLTHEHFSLTFQKFYVEPPQQLQNYLHGGITLENAGLIRQYPYSNKYNLTFDDKETHAAVLTEMQMFNEFGGGTIVENTSHGLNRNIPLMIEVSQKTGIHVVAGTGYYVAGLQPQSTLQMSIEDLANVMHSELTEGCFEDKSVRCGFIGEVGCSWPLHEFEKNVIKATAEVQSSLDCPVSFHPGRHPKAPFEIMRLFAEAGGKAGKTIMSHLDRTILETETLLEYASLGSYLQQDLFGTECSWYQLEPNTDMLSDAQRIQRIVELISNGLTDRILMAHDIHTKHRLVKFGGHGFSHIINNVIPKMEIKGIEREKINQILMKNPQTWLSSKVIS
ncbi:phosphotriesterase-related protein [Schistocerca serialis cubense]|uniref:phosphotriesterase-related protein n=1 Tax=Schistocerca serialis cubense TaxID=2023355 RepID=UPI00214E538C|nr:phosphotriesterase-related protein [Schistocerca serialis cubense]